MERERGSRAQVRGAALRQDAGARAYLAGVRRVGQQRRVQPAARGPRPRRERRVPKRHRGRWPRLGQLHRDFPGAT